MPVSPVGAVLATRLPPNIVHAIADALHRISPQKPHSGLHIISRFRRTIITRAASIQRPDPANRETKGDAKAIENAHNPNGVNTLQATRAESDSCSGNNILDR